MGLASDIVNDYYVSLSAVYSAYRSKTKLLGEYRIERCVIKRWVIYQICLKSLPIKELMKLKSM